MFLLSMRSVQCVQYTVSKVCMISRFDVLQCPQFIVCSAYGLRVCFTICMDLRLTECAALRTILYAYNNPICTVSVQIFCS